MNVQSEELTIGKSQGISTFKGHRKQGIKEDNGSVCLEPKGKNVSQRKKNTQPNQNAKQENKLRTESTH